jgi:hypothetical protein
MSRATYLTVAETDLLNDWGRALKAMFGACSYHVGSSLLSADWRDVDVRHIPRDPEYADLSQLVNIDRLNLAVSLWGRHVTGLPIDWQVQQRTAANEEFGGHRRNALGISQRGWSGRAASPREDQP